MIRLRKRKRFEVDRSELDDRRCEDLSQEPSLPDPTAVIVESWRVPKEPDESHSIR